MKENKKVEIYESNLIAEGEAALSATYLHSGADGGL